MRLLGVRRNAPYLLDRLSAQSLQTLRTQQTLPRISRLRDIQPKQKLDDILVCTLSRCFVEGFAVARERVEQGKNGEKVDFVFEGCEAEGKGDAVLFLEAVECCLGYGGEKVVDCFGVDLREDVSLRKGEGEVQDLP